MWIFWNFWYAVWITLWRDVIAEFKHHIKSFKIFTFFSFLFWIFTCKSCKLFILFKFRFYIFTCIVKCNSILSKQHIYLPEKTTSEGRSQSVSTVHVAWNVITYKLMGFHCISISLYVVRWPMMSGLASRRWATPATSASATPAWSGSRPCLTVCWRGTWAGSRCLSSTLAAAWPPWCLVSFCFQFQFCLFSVIVIFHF